MAFGSAAVPPVTFELSDAEATSAFVVPAKQRRLMLGVFGANIAIGLISAVLESGVFFSPRHANPTFAGFQLLMPAVFSLGLLLILRGPKPRNQWARSVAFDDAGMHLAGKSGRARVVPWRSIRSVNDSGTVFELQYGILRSVIIPRRAYADDGAALWLLLTGRLIGTRSLQRRPDSRIIINTAAR